MSWLLCIIQKCLRTSNPINAAVTSKRVLAAVPVLIAVVNLISVNSTQLFAIAAQRLRMKYKLPTTTVAELLHYRIYLYLKHFGKLQVNWIQR